MSKGPACDKVMGKGMGTQPWIVGTGTGAGPWVQVPWVQPYRYHGCRYGYGSSTCQVIT